MTPTSTISVTVLIGHPRSGSRTVTVAQQVTKTLRAALGDYAVDMAEPDIVDLSGYGVTLATQLAGARFDGPVGAALRLVSRPGLLIVVSPTFKGSYTGLLKMFFDLLPRDGLVGPCVAVPVVTAGLSHHRGIAERHLRPLLRELGAEVPVDGLCVGESDFDAVERAVEPWLAQAAPALADALRKRI